MNNENILNSLGNKYVFFPFLGSSFILGLFLLLYKDLELIHRNCLVPAIAIYAVGTLLIGYFYYELDLINCVRATNKGEKAEPQPKNIVRFFRILHVSWFLLLIIYLFFKCVI